MTQKSYQLFHGDCIEQMATLPAGSVDMVLTDLPYGTTANKWDSIIPLDRLWSAWKRVCKPGAAIVLFSQQPFAASLITSNPKRFRYEWIWSKPQGAGFLNAKRAPLRSHENILVFCDRQPPYFPQMRQGFKPYKSGGGSRSQNYTTAPIAHVNSDGSRYPITVLPNARDTNRLHPTQKPVALCEYLIRTYTNEGDTVLDCTMGSGTTGVAALRARRYFVGIERDPKYFAAAKSRLDKILAVTESPHSQAAPA